MEKETILELYYGKLNPQDMGMIEKDDYQTHSSRFWAQADHFCEKLSPKLQEEFRNMCEEEMKADEILHRDGFCKGFQMGIKLAAESLI